MRFKGGGLAVVVVAAIVVVATMPSGAVGTTDTGPSDIRSSNPVGTDLSPGNPLSVANGSGGDYSDPSDAPAKVKKREAVRVLENLETENEKKKVSKKIADALARLDGTVQYYVDSHRLESSSAFSDDAKAVRDLSHLDSTELRDGARRATNLTYAADNESAHVAVSDARRVFERFRHATGTSGHRQSAESHLENAVRALEQAEQVFDRSRGTEEYFGNRAKAITHLRKAHHQAALVVDTLDRSVEPTVSVSSRSDPVRNGSRPVVYELRGNISDPKPASIENVTVRVNDDRTVTPETTLDAAKPGMNVTFSDNVTLGDRIAELEVRVTTTASTGSQAKQRGKSGNSAAKSNSGDGADRLQVAATSLKLDGDGLTDVQERTVFGSDPLDPDSDLSETPENEADNGIVDGREDPDGDNVTNAGEIHYETDPFEADTDSDDLQDRYEILVTDTEPNTPDTNENGVVDGKEDSDEDGLTNAGEARRGTNPQNSDTDADGVSDGVEVDRGTDPLAADTDNDYLEDGSEHVLGTDPRDPDTDADGILDGNETYTTTLQNGELGTELSLNGTGDVSSQTSVRQQTARFAQTERVQNLSVSSIVDIESRATFENATLSLQYDESELPDGNESALAIFTYNETRQMYVPLNSTVDAQDNTVSAETTHFSTFVVFPITNWATALTAEEPSSGGGDSDSEVQPVDVVFTIDSSGSMSWNDPNDFRKQAAKEFVGALLGPDRAGVVDFDGDAHVAQELTGNLDQVNLTIDHLDALGGTDIGSGLRTANDHFGSASDGSRSQVTVLLTDGQGPGGIAAAETAASRDITVHTIGFGGADRGKLSEIASITGGSFNYVDSASDLPDVFSRVADDVGATHSDDDGLSDELETSGIPVGFAGVKTGHIETDPEDADTDGDGLGDDTEIGELQEYDVHFWVNDERYSYESRYYTLNSDPTEKNSDEAGLGDKAEYEQGSDPLRPETLTVSAKINTRSTLDGEGDPTPIEMSAGSQNKLRDEYWPATLERADRWNTLDRGFIIGSPKPDWLKGYDIEQNTDYYRVPVDVYVGGSETIRNNPSEYEDDLPDRVGLRFPESDVEILDTRLTRDGLSISGGAKQGYLIVEEPNTRRAGQDSEVSPLERPELRVTLPSGSIFQRPESFYRNHGIDSNEVVGNTLVHSGETKYGVLFGAKQHYGERLGVGAHQVSEFAQVMTIATSAQSAAAWYLTSDDATVAIIAVSVNQIDRLLPGDTGIGPVSIVNKAYQESSSYFVSQERLDELRSRDDQPVFRALSGPDLSISS